MPETLPGPVAKLQSAHVCGAVIICVISARHSSALSRRSLIRMIQPTIKAVIFDHDGTLVDSEPVHLRCWGRVLAPYGCTLTTAEYNRNLSGMPSIASANWLADKFNLDRNPDALLSAKQKLLEEFLTSDAYPLMPGITELLEYLSHKELPLGVASGADRLQVQSSLDAHEFNRYFSAVATKNDVANNKPAPDVFLHAAQLLGIAPQECVAIEDSDTGERAACAAGMYCLRLHPQPRTCSKAGVRRFVDLEEMRRWFADVLGEAG